MFLNFEKSSNMEKNCAEMSLQFLLINNIIYVYYVSPGNDLKFICLGMLKLAMHTSVLQFLLKQCVL